MMPISAFTAVRQSGINLRLDSSPQHYQPKIHLSPQRLQHTGTGCLRHRNKKELGKNSM